MKKNKIDEVKLFWNERAALKEKAGSNDFVLKEIEIGAIKKYINNGEKILEFGCGSGGTAIEMAKSYSVDITAIDYSEPMIEAAKEYLSTQENLKGSIKFRVEDIRSMKKFEESYDIAITERVLINLESWEEQKSAIENIIRTLRPGGKYIMCENSIEGLERINFYREACGLSPISPPWHNNYLKETQISEMNLADANLIAVEHISSSYYFVSRVINAWLAKENGEEPQYDAVVNRLGLELPELGDLGQTKLWIFVKE